MKRIVYILLISTLLVSCGEYQKALKSEDIAEKFKVGTELYEAEKWNKAHRLFAQIVPQYRGKPQAEKLMYMYSMCSYKMEDYYIAGYQFERFKDAYPKSEKAEEAFFLSAKSYYQLSPVYTKEQKETKEAIEKLQLFINQYPDSEYLAESNTLIRELDFKLEQKAFAIAKQYNKISDYKASVKSFNNFLLEFPGTTLRKDAMYSRFEAAYNLALNSIESKKDERIESAISYYNAFKKSYPQSEYLADADIKKADLEVMKSAVSIEEETTNTKS
ncbi:MAG: outer membrane protein assembly factor BamD [Bacteroidota bacterium]